MRSTRLLVLFSVLAVCGLGLVLLTSCVAGIGKDADTGRPSAVFTVGEGANDAVTAIHRADSEAKNTVPPPGTGWFDSLLNVLGWAGLVLGGGGAATVGVRKVAWAGKYTDAEKAEIRAAVAEKPDAPKA